MPCASSAPDRRRQVACGAAGKRAYLRRIAAGTCRATKPEFRPMRLIAALFAVLFAAAILTGPLRAQDAAAPFDDDLQHLAEILGTLHYLRDLCGAKEGQKWRDEMLALVEAETPAGERRTRMVAAFNRGYHGFQQTYRGCTPAAKIAIRRYLAEGAKISRDLTARYAN